MADIDKLLSFLMMIAFLGPCCYSQSSTTDTPEVRTISVATAKKILKGKNKNPNQMDKPKEATSSMVWIMGLNNWTGTSAASLILNEQEQKMAPIPKLPEPSRNPPVADAYYVEDPTTGKVCILAKFNAEITIKYSIEGSKDSERETKISPTKLVSSSGKCGNVNQDDNDAILHISWLMGLMPNAYKYNLELHFRIIKRSDESDENDKVASVKWEMSSIEFTYDTGDSIYFPNALNKEKYTARSINTTSYFSSPINTSYCCKEEDPIPLFSDNPKQKITVVLTKIKIRPYNVPSSLDFGSENICSRDSLKRHYRDDTVPIAMGSTFAVLALVVIIGYAVHRSVSDRKLEYKNVD